MFSLIRVEKGRNKKFLEKRSMRRIDNGTLQLMTASVMVIVGCVLLGFGFAFPPKGEIHSSVLVAFGEILTFAGALFGIDYRYRR